MVAALPDIGLAAAALLLLLIAAALWVLQGLVRLAFHFVPIIGGWISSHIDSALNDARNAVLKGAASSWHGAVSMLNWLSGYLWGMFDQAVITMVDAAGTVANIVEVQLPRLAADAEATASRLVGVAEAEGRALVAGVVREVSADITTVERDARSLFTAAELETARLVAAAEGQAAALVRGAEQLAADSLARASTVLQADITAAGQLAGREVAALAGVVGADVSALERGLASGLATAEAAAAASLAAVRAGVYTDLETWGDQAVSRAWPDAAGDLGALRDAIGADFPWLNDLLGALGGLGTAGLAGALIRSMATSQAVTRLATDCIVPNCRNLSGLGQLLEGLLGDAAAAAMLAWVIFMVTDPGGWSADMQAVAVTPASDAINAFAHLVGG